MKRGMMAGVLFILFGLALTFGVLYVFPPCEPSGQSAPMRCWWTARAELGLGLAALFGGILQLAGSSASFRAGVAAMLLALAALAAAMPLHLIGVCKSETMPCRLAMYPALIIVAGLIGATALAVWIRCGRER